MKLIILISLLLTGLGTGCMAKPTTPPVLDTTLSQPNHTLEVAAHEHEHLIFTNGAALRTLQPSKYPVGAVLTNLEIDPFQGILEGASVVVPTTHSQHQNCWFANDLDLSSSPAYCTE